MAANREGEKRQYARLDTTVKIIYGVMAKVHKPFSSLSKNVSSGGICIPLERRLKVGEVLELEVDVPGKQVPIFALGRIAWVKKNMPQGKDARYYPYQGGVEFIAIEQEERESILKFAS